LPAAIVVAAICLLIAFAIAAIFRPEFNLKIKDWVEFGSKPKMLLPSAVPEVVQSLEQSGNSKPGLDGDAIDTALTVKPEEGNKVEWKDLFDTKANDVLESSFKIFKEKSNSYQEDADFWESWFVKRKHEIGQTDLVTSLELLATSNPSWVWPIVFLIRRHIEFCDADAAKAALARGLSRSTPLERKWVLAEGVRYHARLCGTASAYEFCRAQLASDITDADAGTLLLALAEEVGTDGDVYSSALIKELALRYDVSLSESRFQLAFDYAETESFNVPAFIHYKYITIHDSEVVGALNNLGVIYGNAGRTATQNEYYERASSQGNAVSKSNISQTLIQNGLHLRAENLLKEIKEDQLELPQVADAFQALASAKNAESKALAKFEVFAESQCRVYRDFISMAFSRWRGKGSAPISGEFISSDKTITITLVGDTGDCEYKFAGKLYRGKMIKKALCFEGSLHESGQSILSLGTGIQFLAILTPDDSIRAIIWPRHFHSDPIVDVTLRPIAN